jgi:cell division septation protein DedD
LPKNDEGEFELVLGNRQLISVFVIVVVLLGVFFSMGYIVGRNSSQSAVESARNDRPKPDTDATDNSSAASNDGATSPDTTAPNNSATSAAADSAPATPPEATTPAQSEAPAPAPAKPKPSVAKETKPKPSPAPPPAAPASSAPVHASAAGEPSSGAYWQVVATARPDAEIIAEALGKKGFHVVLAPAPKGNIFRVLVGPLANASAQASTRTNLESAGFKNPILRKY